MPIKVTPLTRILVIFLLLETSVLLIWQHCPFLDLPLVSQFGYFWPQWFQMSKLLLNQFLHHLNNINLMLILNLTLGLLNLFFLHPFLPLCLVKVLILVTRKLRRRRKWQRRRSKIRRGATNQPMLPIQLVWRNLPINPTKLNSLACYVRATTFLEIFLVFTRYYKCGLQVHINLCHQPLEIMLVISHHLMIARSMGKGQI